MSQKPPVTKGASFTGKAPRMEKAAKVQGKEPCEKRKASTKND